MTTVSCIVAGKEIGAHACIEAQRSNRCFCVKGAVPALQAIGPEFEAVEGDDGENLSKKRRMREELVMLKARCTGMLRQPPSKRFAGPALAAANGVAFEQPLSSPVPLPAPPRATADSFLRRVIEQRDREQNIDAVAEADQKREAFLDSQIRLKCSTPGCGRKLHETTAAKSDKCGRFRRKSAGGEVDAREDLHEAAIAEQELDEDRPTPRSLIGGAHAGRTSGDASESAATGVRRQPGPRHDEGGPRVPNVPSTRRPQAGVGSVVRKQPSAGKQLCAGGCGSLFSSTKYDKCWRCRVGLKKHRGDAPEEPKEAPVSPAQVQQLSNEVAEAVLAQRAGVKPKKNRNAWLTEKDKRRAAAEKEEPVGNNLTDKTCEWKEEPCDRKLGANNRNGLCSKHGCTARLRKMRAAKSSPKSSKRALHAAPARSKPLAPRPAAPPPESRMPEATYEGLPPVDRVPIGYAKKLHEYLRQQGISFDVPESRVA